MSDFTKYLKTFFDELEVFEDLSRGHNYKVYLHQAILEFLENETKQKAFDVYKSFFDSYRITLPGESNPFIDLLDVLRSYEENAATLIAKQRDHYIHSVNVFILGLSIYAKNTNYRAAFDTTNMDKTNYPYSYDTKHEEFFYRWGIASLFHDVGYPIEIIGKQINNFMSFATVVDAGPRVKSHLEFENFGELNSIVEIIPKREFIKTYYNKYDSCVYVDLLKPIDLLSHKLHTSLGVDLKGVKAALDSFVEIMAKSGFIDHGFYSAIIVLKWYGFLIQSCKYKPEYYFYPVLDSASAILLHNYYKNVIMKPPFDKNSLSPYEHPIAYLLILCDELQDWNREAYGIASKKLAQAEEVSIVLTDKQLDITYIDNNGMLPQQFSEKKEDTLHKLLEIDRIFEGGFSVGCEAMNELVPEINQESSLVARPLINNLEKIAIAIHELYNQKQLGSHPDKPLAYPMFSDLPDALKYSNLRQARSIGDKLEIMGWEMRPQGSVGKVISEIPKGIVEKLAIIEHDNWVQERLSSGWVFGEIKNVDKKISPYLIPYNELTDEVKDFDRDTVRNIPALLNMIGMAVYSE